MKKVEVSLKELLIYVLRRWKFIIGLSLFIAIMVGGYSYLRQLRSNSMDASTTVNQATQLSISIDLVDFDNANLNAHTENTARNDRVTKLQTKYLIIAQAAPLREILEGIVPEGVSEIALRNQINIDSPSAGIINISVNDTNGMDSKMSAEAMYNYMSASTEYLSQSVAAHRLSLLASSSITKSVVSDREPIIKNTVYGLIFGFVVSTIIFVLVYLICLPIQIPEQFQRHLNIRFLGGVKRKKHLALADMLAGSLRMAKEEEAMEIIAANIVEFSGNNKRILITGTVGAQLNHDFAKSIASIIKDNGICFTSGSDINNNAETITALASSDAVIFVERIDISKLKRVNEARERIDMSKKEILGYVLF